MYEIQFHPADIRKQVKYYFLSRRAFRWIVSILVAVALVLAVGAILAPLGVQALLLSSELRVMSQQNNLQRDILSQRTSALARTQQRVDAARSRQQQISLILGAPQESTGLGGFPEPIAIDVSVHEARQALQHATQLNTESKALLTLADELANFARENQELTAVVPSICPVPIGNFVLTSPFGDRVSPFTNSRDFHSGIDLAAREGTPVLASGDGRVVFAGRFPLRRNVRWWRYGNVVVLTHGGRYLSIYAHLEAIEVRRGQQVTRGEQIGTVGNTGWSTSPHLHYEVRVMQEDESSSEPVPVDPRIYILDYQWRGHEAILIAGRNAPPPAFDPLPSRLKVR
jgi:murein DD-endopeptidase MepM/ murein hydrolase activator NlpD